MYSLNVGNAARNRSQELTKCEVISVSRKYFEVSPIAGDYKWKEKFHIDGWGEVTNYSSNHCLYETDQEFFDEKESIELLKKIRDHFGMHGKCSTSKHDLKKIIDILAL